MRSPRDMQIIQIDITNACIHECSNCTRFCGHHRKPFFMEFETFRRAVDSLWDFKGTIGIMGGEPTLHPEFARFATYLHEHIKYRKSEHGFIRPVGDFMAKMQQQEIHYHGVHENAYGKRKRAIYGAGLWSTLPPTYYKYYELIQDVFKMQALNDHANVMYHSPILFSRKDMGISDEDWPEIRDRCWAQQLWSASVTPKGAFFCEIAGALDMLLDGPGGVSIEPGWWLRDPEEFQQYEWCEFCGISLANFSRDAREEVDDVSASMAERLRALGSKKMMEGRYYVMRFDGSLESMNEAAGKQKEQHANAWEDFLDRQGTTAQDVLHVHRLEGIAFCEDHVDCLLRNSKQFDRLIVAVPERCLEKVQQQMAGVDCELYFLSVQEQSFGQMLNCLLKHVSPENFFVYLEDGVQLAEGFRERLLSKVLNPGTLLWSELGETSSSFALSYDEGKKKSLMVFNQMAQSFRRAGFDRIAACTCVRDFVALWEEEKVVSFTEENFTDDFPVIEAGKRYLVYGAGGHGERVTKQIVKLGSEIICYSDTDSEKWGKRLHGRAVVPPEKFVQHKAEADKIIIASDGYPEIIMLLRQLGVQEHEYMVNAF